MSTFLGNKSESNSQSVEASRLLVEKESGTEPAKSQLENVYPFPAGMIPEIETGIFSRAESIQVDDAFNKAWEINPNK